MNQSELYLALKNMQRVYGTLISSPNPKWVPEIKKTGIDFVFIDTEHIPLDRVQVSFMCHAYKGAGMTPIVRIPSPNAYDACVALDGGASGVVFPYVETPEQAKQLRGAVKYRPLKGQKLQDFLDGKIELSGDELSYLKKYNKDNMMILNIESKKAVDNLDSILEVPDIDCIFIGPHDLSINLGCPEDYDNPIFNEAVLHIIDTCIKYNVSVANHFSFGIEKQIEWGRHGMNVILWNADIIRFSQIIQEDLRYIKGQFGEAYNAGAGIDSI